MSSSMYLVIAYSKTLPPFSDLIAALVKEFPETQFTIAGTEEKGYQCRVMGTADEVAPRVFAKAFLKTWKPKPEGEESIEVKGIDVIPFPSVRRPVYETLDGGYVVG